MRDFKIEVLRLFSIVAVVFYHADFVSRYSDVTMGYIYVMRALLGWCVISFFMISGYVNSRARSFRDVARDKTRRLLVPYVCVSLFIYLSLGFIDAFVYEIKEYDFSLQVFIFALISFKGVGPQLYFLPYLFLISVVVSGIGRRFAAIELAIFFGLLFLAKICYWGQSAHTGWGGGNLPLYFFAYSFGGLIYSATVLKLVPQLYETIVICIIFAFLCILNFLTVCYILFPVFLYLAISRVFQPSWSNYFNWFKPGAVYIWHTPIVLPVFSLVFSFLGLNEVFNVFFSCLGSICVALLIDRILAFLRLNKVLSIS